MIAAPTVASMDAMTLDRDAPADRVLELLSRWGLAILPGYLDAATVETMAREFHLLLDEEAPWISPINYPMGKAIAVFHPEMDRARFPVTHATFSTGFMHKIIDGNLGRPNVPNHRLYLTRSTVGMDEDSVKLHYDAKSQLKFAFYLSDTTAKNGATRLVPGTHVLTKAHERENRKAGVSPPPERVAEFVKPWNGKSLPVEGPAGTLFVFDTDTLHQASAVEVGERWVIRGHSRAETAASGFWPALRRTASTLKSKILGR